MSDTGEPSRAAAVEALLTREYDAPVTVTGWQRVATWTVARVQLDGTGVPPTAVVKWVRGDHHPTHTETWRLCTEVAALQFLSDDLGVALAPGVIAADIPAGLVALTDLAPRVALDQLIRRDGAAAHTHRIAAFARVRGELSAATAGHADTYYARRDRVGPVDRAADRVGRFAHWRNEAREHAAALGVPVTGPAAADLAAALDELNDPGPFLALSNGDAEANNVLVHEAGAASARLIDFEFAGYTHALADAVCLYVPGPAWLTVGEPPGTVVDQYREALATGIPEAADDRRYGFGMAAACVSWALIRLRRVAALDGREPGDRSRLQLVATLESTARTAERQRVLPHLAGWLLRLADLLRARWPDADLDYTDPVAFPPYLPRH